MILSVVIITHNEEANIGRTLASVQSLVADGKGEIIVVDSGSTDLTVEIAKSFGAKVFIEKWKGYAAQKNSAIDKSTGDWILSLDADEELRMQLEISLLISYLEGLGRSSLTSTEFGLAGAIISWGVGYGSVGSIRTRSFVYSVVAAVCSKNG